MAYKIVEKDAVTFADNRSIKFPRFQRKQTWDEKDNFKLCISIFKGYPIGVVIVNSQGGSDFLLDGRQRRNALKLMKDDPKSVYLWAKAFVKFRFTQEEESLKEQFWCSIDEYLQHEAAKIPNQNEDDQNQIEEEVEYEEENKENSYDFEKQYNSLKSLLDLIVLCHPFSSGKTRLQKMYEFGHVLENDQLDYTDPVNGEYVVNHIKLKKFIENLIEDEIDTIDDFANAIIRKFRVNDKNAVELKKYIVQHEEYYLQSLRVIEQINEVLNHATVGMISLTNADVLDAQNIFSLVNHSGTPLSAEELLSARPFWNVNLNNPSAELIEYKKEMYKFLGITIPEETCRWDLCSTFLKRIDKNGLIFENEKNSFTTSISLSYRIISAIFVGGINNTSVTSLEKNAKIDWEIDIERVIKELNVMIPLIEDIDHFKYLSLWNQSIMSLTSNSIAIEFCTLMYKTWCELQKPTRNSSNYSVFCRNAVVLFDRLVYEYSIRTWTGSGDSMVASHLKDPKPRFVMVAESDWTNFIDEIVSGQYKGKPTSSKTLKPFLYNSYFLKEMRPNFKNSTTKYDIDHLIAQKFFKDNPAMEPFNKYKDNFLNFSILPQGDNIEKTDKKLSEITDKWLLEQIKYYASIDDRDIAELSDLSNIKSLERRKASYEYAYKDLRNKLFSNLK